jgi:hypothetical protein
METGLPHRVERMLYSDNAAERYSSFAALERVAADSLRHQELFYARYSMLSRVATVLIFLSVFLSSLFVIFLLQGFKDFGSPKNLIMVLTGWCVVITIVPVYFLWSSLSDKRRYNSLKHEADELEEVLHKELARYSAAVSEAEYGRSVNSNVNRYVNEEP